MNRCLLVQQIRERKNSYNRLDDRNKLNIRVIKSGVNKHLVGTFQLASQHEFVPFFIFMEAYNVISQSCSGVSPSVIEHECLAS